MFTRRTIVTAGIVAMLAAASLVGATAANADPLEHVMANQAALETLSAAGQKQDFTSPDAKDAAAAVAAVKDTPAKAPVTGSYYPYSHSPGSPDLVPDGATPMWPDAKVSGPVTPYVYVPGDLETQPQPAPDTRDAADSPKPVPGGRALGVSSDTDSGVSGSDLLLGIGVAGGLALLVLLATRGTKGTRPTLGSH